jgi:acetoin utilization deacetylase AcuC-like enzyme
VERSRRSSGATLAAAREALTRGWSANLAGGTHHAHRDRGEGFCVFNDAAIAARALQQEAGLQRVAIVDCDVHQGNGTASIFADDPTVFTLSLHGAKNFPFRKERSDLDVELPDGCGDEAYLRALDDALAELWRRHGDAPPGLIFYVAGADPHEGDRLGRLKLTIAGLAQRDQRVLTAARERRIPVAISMAGGYGRNIEDTVQIHLGTLRAAAASWRQWNNVGS